MDHTVFYIAMGIIALFILGSFIHAIRMSYKIERLDSGPPTTPKFANVFGHALGLGVPKTPEGQALRRRLLTHLGFALIGFTVMSVIVLVFR